MSLYVHYTLTWAQDTSVVKMTTHAREEVEGSIARGEIRFCSITLQTREINIPDSKTKLASGQSNRSYVLCITDKQHTDVGTSMDMHARTHMHADTHACTHTHAHTNKYTGVHTHMHTHTCTHARTCTHKHTSAHTKNDEGRKTFIALVY